MLRKGMFFGGIIMVLCGLLLLVPGCPPTEDNLPEGLEKVLINFGCEGCAPLEIRKIEEQPIGETETLPPSIRQPQEQKKEGEIEGEIESPKPNSNMLRPLRVKQSTSDMGLALICISVGALGMLTAVILGPNLPFWFAGALILGAAGLGVGGSIGYDYIRDVINDEGDGGGGGGGGGEEEEAPDPDLLGVTWICDREDVPFEYENSGCMVTEDEHWEFEFDYHKVYWYLRLDIDLDRYPCNDPDGPTCAWENFTYDVECDYQIGSSGNCKTISFTNFSGTQVYTGCRDIEPVVDMPGELDTDDWMNVQYYIVGNNLYFACGDCSDPDYCEWHFIGE
jgi:hypothetical protein